jgi:hypothetical protein
MIFATHLEWPGAGHWSLKRVADQRPAGASGFCRQCGPAQGSRFCVRLVTPCCGSKQSARSLEVSLELAGLRTPRHTEDPSGRPPARGGLLPANGLLRYAVSAYSKSFDGLQYHENCQGDHKAARAFFCRHKLCQGLMTKDPVVLRDSYLHPPNAVLVVRLADAPGSRFDRRCPGDPEPAAPR